jgi:hypothetical protein
MTEQVLKRNQTAFRENQAIFRLPLMHHLPILQKNQQSYFHSHINLPSKWELKMTLLSNV